MPYDVPQLRFDFGALEPFLSADTLQFHHERIHRGYTDAVNHMILGL